MLYLKDIIIPKVKIQKDAILHCALTIIRDEGHEKLNARGLAKKLNCSTQPIFSNYPNMDELKKELKSKALEIYSEHMELALEKELDNKYLASGLGYIDFARKEKNLYHFIFMDSRDHKTFYDDKKHFEKITYILSQQLGISEEDTFQTQVNMWVVVYGIAAMMVTSYMEFTDKMIVSILTNTYNGLKNNFKKI